jgi:hypothetical protein
MPDACLQGMPQTNPQQMKPYDQETIRHFFAMRKWLRPSDYESFSTQKLKPKRVRELSIYIRGYESAKDGTFIFEP